MFIAEQVVIEVVNGDNDIIISVTNNFTTDLTYRVNVTKTTGGSSETLPPNFNASKQIYFSYTNHSVCDIFTFIVTPIAMDMEGRPSKPVTGFFTLVTGTVCCASNQMCVCVCACVCVCVCVCYWISLHSSHRW